VPAPPERRGTLRSATILLGLAGLALGTALVAWFGFDHVLASLQRVGWSGFAAYTAAQVLLFVTLALAWHTLTPNPGRQAMPIFVWARMVRDSVSQLLPFSPIAGFVVGARVVALHGIAWPAAAAGTIVDMTAEFLAELAFVVLGLLILLAHAPNSDLVLPIGIGLALAGIAAACLIWLQRGAAGLISPLIRRLSRRWARQAASRLDQVQSLVSRVYDHKLQLALGCTLHLLCWIGTGFASWIAYRALGAPIPLPVAVAIEALLHASMTATFFVPGHVGVQEAAYAGIGAIFGLPPEVSLSVSLLRRARDIVLGVPILLAWQALEVRRLRLVREG